MCPATQPSIFPLGLLQDRNIAIGIFPECEKVLVCGASLIDIAFHRIGAGKAQVRERANWIVQHDAAMVDNLLELRRGFAALPTGEKRFSTKLSGIQGACHP